MDTITDLSLLSAFVAVAEERHFGRAAERLHVAQPVISRRIQRLEQLVGVALIERTTRHVALTEAGSTLLDAARRLLHDADLAVERARRVAEGGAGRLTVGFVESAAFELLAPLLRELDAHVPGLTLDLRELTTEQHLGELRGHVDVAIVRELGYRELADAGLEARHLLRERLHVALPAAHPLGAEAQLALRQVADEPFVLFPRHRVPRVYDHVFAVCDTAGFRPRLATHALQYTTMLAFVDAARGAALVPGSVRTIRPAGVRLIPLVDDHAVTDLSLTWWGPMSPMREGFVRAAVAVAARASPAATS